VLQAGITLQNDDAVANLEVTLDQGRQSSIEGLVTEGTAGQPQAGATITVGVGEQQVATATADAAGRYRVAGLGAGSYWAITGDGGAAIAGIRLDGWGTRTANLTVPAPAGYRYVVVTERLLSKQETDNDRKFFGRVLDEAGQGMNGIAVEMAWTGVAPGAEFPRVTTPRDPFKPAGNFEFLHSAGTFLLRVVQASWPSDETAPLPTANVPGREGDPISYEINFQLLPTGGAAGTGSLAGVVANGAGLGLTLWQGDPEQAGQPGQRSWAQVLPAGGAYAFRNLPAGPYTLALEGEGVVHAFTLADGASSAFNYVVSAPPQPPPPLQEKPLASYWLLGRSAQGSTLLGLLLPHLRRQGAMAGASLAEARQAAMVTIVGGDEVATAADEQALLAAGCQVQRLPGDPFALAEVLQL
jgi:hypothetical protein